MSHEISTDQLSTTTLISSIFSVFGSIVVIASYAIARTKSNPKAAQLILNLAVADLFWFVPAAVLSSYWVSDVGVPRLLCMVCSPTLAFARIASLVWTSMISFDVYMSVNRRKWLWKNEENRWELYRRRYLLAVILLSTPLPIYTIILQQENPGFGCEVGYESIGNWAVFFFPELFPILCGYVFILVMVFLVRKRMAINSFPRSVRKRRRRIMYYYVLASFVCWTPVIVFYCCELFVSFGVLNQEPWLEILEIIARATHFSTGFFNFIIFGMSDPHLKRSFNMVVYYLGCSCCLSPAAAGNSLKIADVEKSVMFDGPISASADLKRNKRETQKHIKLTIDEKLQLYKDRPDLDPRNIRAPLLKKRSSSSSTAPPTTSPSRSISRQKDERKNRNTSASYKEKTFAAPHVHIMASQLPDVQSSPARTLPAAASTEQPVRLMSAEAIFFNADRLSKEGSPLFVAANGAVGVTGKELGSEGSRGDSASEFKDSSCVTSAADAIVASARNGAHAHAIDSNTQEEMQRSKESTGDEEQQQDLRWESESDGSDFGGDGGSAADDSSSSDEEDEEDLELMSPLAFEN